MRIHSYAALCSILFAFSIASRAQDSGVSLRLAAPAVRVSGGGLSALVQRPDVQGALALGMRQRTAIRELFAAGDQRRVMVSVQGDQSTTPDALQRQVDEQIRSQLTGRDNQIKAILKPEQWSRLLELDLQWRGPMALADDEVARRLEISAASRSRIASIVAAYNAEKSEVLASLSQTQQDTSPDGSRRVIAMRLDTSELDKPMSPARKRLEKAKREADARALEALTDEERGRWKAACGDPFTFRADIKGHRF